MTEPTKTDPVLKPQDQHATGTEENSVTTLDQHATGGDIRTLDQHATGGDITTLDQHATSEPFKPTQG
ncbi:hypothetical protein [Streptomyces vilmorinianum]|uniref:hypothetical protein n=1 Tax=Streptomyces vilmorinianum TaxID=3051092 RepID=UPI0010FB1320|nr:hypothetical protein [Streptomyces vilmorinianum]